MGQEGLVDPIAAVSDRMDAWRHLPKYQLERRSDLFFSLYLALSTAGSESGTALRTLPP